MWFRVLIVVFFFSFSSFAQELVTNTNVDASNKKVKYYLDLFLRTDTNTSTVSTARIESFISKLEEKRNVFQNDHDFLKHLFVKTHQKILKNYVEYCSFNAVLTDGTYNCLTGTALYAILLNHFNIDFRIIETNYHIFLIAKTPQGDILFESTDPLSGFVDTKEKIEDRTRTYFENEIQNSNGDKINFLYGFNIYNLVTLEQLQGLFYFNFSIDSYNHKDLIASIHYLDKASGIYQSKRFEAFSKIILLTVEAGKFDDDEKEICLKKINSLRQKMPVVASKTPTY